MVVSSHGSTSWQLRRVTSRLGARPGGFAVLNMCGEDACLSIHRTYCFVNLGTTRFNITANFASVDICGRMKELVVPWLRCSHFGVLNLSEGSPSPVWAVRGGRYRSMGTHCLRLRMLRSQRRNHIRIVFNVFLEFVDKSIDRTPVLLVQHVYIQLVQIGLRYS